MAIEIARKCLVSLLVFFAAQVAYAQRDITPHKLETAQVTKERAPSEEMKIILNQLKQNEFTLDLSGFDKLKNKNITQDPLKGEYEEYVFPSPDIKGQDMFCYVIKFDKTSRKFWIWMTGGFAYQNILYGPGYLNDSGSIVRKR